MSGAEIATALAVAQTSDILLKQLKLVSEKLKPFKPDVKSFRIDYTNRNSEVKYLLLVPTGVKRIIQRKIEIPSISGFKFYEMWDLDRMELVNSSWAFDGKNWVLDVTKLPSSEKYWLTVKGQISKNFLDQLVSVKVAENPSRVKENDHYWIHSALTNVEQFDKIWYALNMEQVNADIRIGVERMFSATIPQGLKDKLELQQKLLTAISQGNRNEKTRLEIKYRTSAPTVTPIHLNEILGNLVSAETFAEYVNVGEPFTVNHIEPVKEAGMFVPEKVKVMVQTDLNYDVPTAKGDLCFHRHKYSQFVAEKVKTALKEEKER